jgi:mannose-6-phosphate isomerase-like protein (cupin superfamily)
VTEGFILRTGEGEILQNRIVVKASPATGTLGSILVEQNFPRGGTTNLHLHEQGDELFYVVSGSGTATLGDATDDIGPGDVIFVPRNAVHRIENLSKEEPLHVVFFMDSPELVEEFRAIHERVTAEPDRPITDKERAAISERIGGGRAVR